MKRGSRAAAWVFLLACIALPFACTEFRGPDIAAVETAAPAPEARSVELTILPTERVTPVPTPAPTPVPTPTSTPTPSPTPEPTPERITDAMLDEGLFDSYFDDAIMIGDSLTKTLTNYVRGIRREDEGFLGTAQFMGTVSMSVKNASSDRCNPSGITFLYQGKPVSITAGINASGAKKAFIMLGLNDIGCRSWESVEGYFAALIDVIHEKCPDTEVILLGILPVTKAYCKENGVKIDRWNAFNPILRSICEEHGAKYFSFADRLMDEDGYLRTAFASGTFHLCEQGEEIWIRALRAYAAMQMRPDATVEFALTDLLN